MTARSKSPRTPYSSRKAERRVLSPDHLWAARITKRILADEHPWQLNATIDPADRIAMAVGRGGAKTTTMRARAMIKMVWLRDQSLGYAATTADHARELNWSKLQNACEHYGIRAQGENPDVSFLEAKMRMICHRTGSIYRLRGVEDKADAEKFRGFAQAEFGADEVGSWNPELLAYTVNQCVVPRLGEAYALPAGLLEFILHWDPEDVEELESFISTLDWDNSRGGCVVMGSTPPSTLRGIFYDATREGSTKHRPYELRDEFPDWAGWSSHWWALKNVVDLPDSKQRYPALWFNWQAALRQKEAEQWSDDNPIWKREYLGIWAADDTDTMFRYRPHVDGKPWNQWNPLEWPDSASPRLTTLDETKAILAKLRADHGDIRVVVSADEGFKDPFAVNAFAFSPRDPLRTIWHISAFERVNVYDRQFAELIIGEAAVKSMVEHMKMPATFGGLFGAIGGWPAGAILDSADHYIANMQNTYGIRFVKWDRKPDNKIAGVELVNGDLIDGRIKILKGTPLERQIMVLQWKMDEYNSKKEDKAQANHSTDTLVMAKSVIARMFESGAVVQETPSAYKDPMGLDSGGEIPFKQPDEFEGLLSDPNWAESDEEWG